MDHLDELRLSYAAKIAALVNALRDIPPDLTPCPRASLVAVREQIYFGWEHPLARAEGRVLLFDKYERDGYWSKRAAELVQSGDATRGKRLLERDHVEPISLIVRDLLAVRQTPEKTAALLQERLVTCTVLAEEHRRLARAHGEGWERYADAGIDYRCGLPDSEASLYQRTLLSTDRTLCASAELQNCSRAAESCRELQSSGDNFLYDFKGARLRLPPGAG